MLWLLVVSYLATVPARAEGDTDLATVRNWMLLLDNDLKPIREVTNLGVGWTVCVSGGAHQYAFLSNSNPNGNMPGTWDTTGEIYKTELDGTVIGKFGKPGKTAPGFQVVHMIDCRNPDEVIVGEIESWRVQKLVFQPTGAKSGSAK